MPAGRPLKEIDKTQFEKLCALQCSLEEICGFFDASTKTIEKWCKETYGENFSQVFAKKREAGKISLRRAQWRLAERNAAMAIWLGKQYLGQRDVVEAQMPEAKSAIEQIAGMIISTKPKGELKEDDEE